MLARLLARIFCFDLLRLRRFSAEPHTSIAHTCTHVCNAVCQRVHPPTPTHTHTHTHALVFVKERLHLLSRAWKLQRFNCWLLLRLNRKRDSLSDGARGRNEYCDVKSQRVPEVRQTGSREGMWRIFFHPLFAPPWWKTGDLLTGWRKLCG